MSAPTIKISEFSVSNLSTTAPKVNQNGGKNISVNYKQDSGSTSMMFQTPRMLSFGVNKWVDPKNSNAEPVCSVTFSFVGMDQNQKLAEFHDTLQQLDEWAITNAQKNSWEWLARKNLSRETIETNYTRCVKVPVDQATGEPNGKPHNLKIKLKSNESGYMCTFFDKSKSVIPSSSVDEVFNKGSHIRALIQCTGIWVAAGTFGLSWKIVQMVVEPRPGIGSGYAFDDEDAPAEESTPVAAKAAASSNTAVSEFVEDEEEVPAAKVVRKVITKK